ncbi:MAG: hypothetical protein C0403_06790 [Desulfobacterium sp.]|nr:hypothetical protein [Desulfobacterium sp.]
MKDIKTGISEFVSNNISKSAPWTKLYMRLSEYLIILLFVSFYIFILTRYFWYLPSPSDPLVYVGPAVENISKGGVYTIDRIALYINLRLFSWIFNNSYISGMIYMVFINALTLTIAMIWAVKRSNIWAAIIFGVLFNTSFLTLGEGFYIYPDQTIALYSLIAFIFFFSDVKPNKYIGPIFYAGVFAAFASFTKIIGTTTFIFFLMVLVFRRDLKNLINYIVGAGCGAAITIVFFCILYDYDIKTLYAKALDLVVFFHAATSLPFGNAYTHHEMLLSLLYFPFIALFMMAGAYREATRYLFLIAWSFVIFIYTTVLINVGSCPPLPHYIWSAYIFVCLGLSLYLSSFMDSGQRTPSDKDKINIAHPLIVSLFLIIIISIGLKLGFKYGAVKTWSPGYITMMPIDIYYYRDFLANTYPKPIKLIFSLGPIIIFGFLIIIEVTKSKKVILSFMILASFWCAFFNGGLAFKHANSVRHQANVPYSFARVLSEIPAKSFCIYLSNMKEVDEGEVEWVYRLFFNNKYPKPKTILQQDSLQRAIINDIVFIKNLYDIDGEYIVTDNPESLLAIHPDAVKYKSDKCENGELHIFKLTDQTFQRLSDTFPTESLIKNGSFENWADTPNTSPYSWYGAGNIIKESSMVKSGRYSAKIVGDDNFNLSQKLSSPELYGNETITLFAWVKTSEKEKYRMEIYDGKNSSFSDFHTGNGKWQLLRVSHNVYKEPEFVEIRAIQGLRTGSGSESAVYVDGVLLFKGNISDPRKNINTK